MLDSIEQWPLNLHASKGQTTPALNGFLNMKSSFFYAEIKWLTKATALISWLKEVETFMESKVADSSLLCFNKNLSQWPQTWIVAIVNKQTNKKKNVGTLKDT